jgi:hypothetical protein
MESNPYAPPVSSIEGTPELVGERPDSDFRDLTGITGKLSILLLIGLALAVLAAVAGVMHINVVSHSYTRAEGLASARRLIFVGGGVSLFYLVTVVVFGRWIYLAQRNLPELDARLLRFTPGAAVWGFFIPVLNLWAPCQAMNQLVRASRNPRQWELEDTPFVIVAWWALWLIVEVLGNVVASASAQSSAVEQAQVGVVVNALSVPLYLLAWLIVRRVWRDQSETRAQQLSLSGF